ncbi:hypothetical protein EGW08_023667 [Elysia chlorotica]|uniref:Uncharacterized protein n=1 Tax=Elysia chlorotica TaxID=188477 RepID=A0A433SI89_ELYCH|nr:hypothetical protein EGW08_023667 [Elysia chlorotica]
MKCTISIWFEKVCHMCKVLLLPCGCKLICNICSVYIHMYRCNCPDFLIKNVTCIDDIHAVHTLKKISLPVVEKKIKLDFEKENKSLKIFKSFVKKITVPQINIMTLIGSEWKLYKSQQRLLSCSRPQIT